MQFSIILRILGILLMFYSPSMLTPLIVNLIYQDGQSLPFLYGFFITFILGFFLWKQCRFSRHELTIRDGFMVVVSLWVMVCLISSLPLIISPNPNISYTDAIFESVSGITTTGASIMRDIDSLPHAILFYRQQMQLIGGMGIVVLAVAILPMLGIGGMQLYRAEMPGPLKDKKLTPRITESAKTFWVIYLILTIICALAYYLAGMNLFDAIGESFSTIATGGFTMHNDSFAFYRNVKIELVGCFFMFAGGINFTLHFLAFRAKSLKAYWHDEEFRWYFKGVLLIALLITLSLLLHKYFSSPFEAAIKSIFNVVSLATTTGFTTASFHEWPQFVPVLVMVIATIGGCAASTAGGTKILRALLLYKQANREIVRLIHPNAVFPIKFGNQTLPRHILQSMWAFLSIFVYLYLIFLLIYMALGNDLTTSVGITTATLANAGAGIGKISNGFADLSTSTKWVGMFAMLAGRLEIFSLLVLFSPRFWRY